VLRWFSLPLMLGVLHCSIPVAFGCDDGVATVAGKPDFPPLSWQKDKKLQGIAYSVIEQVLSELNIKVEVKPAVPWKRVLQESRIGDVDFVVAVRETQERKEYLEFVPTPMMESAQNVFYRSNESFETLNDLKGKIGGVTLGLRFNDEFTKFANENLDLKKVPKLKQNILKLRSNRIDYFISPLLPTLHFIHQNNIKADINFMLNPLFVIEEKVAVSKKSSCIKYIAEIDKRLRLLTESGKIDSLLEANLQQWDVMSSVMEKVNSSPDNI